MRLDKALIVGSWWLAFALTAAVYAEAPYAFELNGKASIPQRNAWNPRPLLTIDQAREQCSDMKALGVFRSVDWSVEECAKDMLIYSHALER
jgi:hypothetical protein